MNNTSEMTLDPSSGIPHRFSLPWDHPSDPQWQDDFQKMKTATTAGGIVAVVGKRGTGKTRMAAEIMREFLPWPGIYTTAMTLFLRIRESFKKTAEESEKSIVDQLSKCRLLVIDEIQERGGSDWENRILDHILDRRYGAIIPTIIIGNLTDLGITECLGDSISSRITENGGIIEMNGPSHRPS
jgi:DNA replication protein DnaC